MSGRVIWRLSTPNTNPFLHWHPYHGTSPGKKWQILLIRLIIPQLLIENQSHTRHQIWYQDYGCELGIRGCGLYLGFKGTALTYHCRSVPRGYVAHSQSPSPSLQGRAVRKTCLRKWHLAWEQLDEMKVVILSHTADGIWVEDVEDQVSVAAFKPMLTGTEQEHGCSG